MSVVVPVRNRRDLLRQTLEGLAAQRFDDFEVIVVDDGSTDGSDREAEAAAGRVRLVRSEGSGAVVARAIGVAAARGEILAFTDSDCVPDPGWLEAGVRSIDGGADLVQGATRPARGARPLERTTGTSREDGLYATCNLFVRRDAFDRAGGFDQDAGRRLAFRFGAQARGLGFGEDTLLGWRVRRQGRTAFEPAAGVVHAVLPPDLRDAVTRAWMAGAFPALVSEVPELRRSLLTGGFVLGPWSRLGLVGGALAACGGRRLLATGLVAWWVRDHARSASAEPDPVRRTLVLGIEVGLDVVREIALVAGSVRARQLVL